LYPQYFLGWPALMVPGAWLGDIGLMNPMYSALTVPPLFLVARRLAGSTWAKAVVMLYLASPMLMLCAATELTHTSCLMTVAWMTWFFLRGRDADAPWWSHAGVAWFFSLGFFIRPWATLGIGLPMLLEWLRDRRSARGADLYRSLAPFLVPAMLMAAVFFAINAAQNGSVWINAYGRYLSYMKENGYRFSGWNEELIHAFTFRFDRSLLYQPLFAGAALFRLNFDLFGWPCSFLFMFFAGWRRVGWLWLSLPTFLLLQQYLAPFDAGIDSFAPVHFVETAWPILLLSVLGLRHLCEREATLAPAQALPRVP